MTMPREVWDAYFLDIARAVSTRATCPRASVGAVLVRDKRILATGYNGARAGAAHCTDTGCRMVAGHCLRAIHAERNVIYQALQYGINTAGATLYVTHSPCAECASDLVRFDVARVVFGRGYGEYDAVVEMMRLGGITCEQGF